MEPDPDASVNLDREAARYIDELRQKLHHRLCASPLQTIAEVEDAVRQIYPPKLAKEAIEYGHNKIKSHHNHQNNHHSVPSNMLSHIGHRVQLALMKDSVKNDDAVTNFKDSVLDYVIGETLRLATAFVKNQHLNTIRRQDIGCCMHANTDLIDLFESNTVANVNNNNNGLSSDMINDLARPRQHRTYTSVVQEMTHAETTYMRDLNFTIKLFRCKLFKLPCDRQTINRIFANLLEIQELTTSLLDSLKDAINTTENNHPELPFVGSTLFELAEDASFDVYLTYAEIVLSHESNQSYASLFSDDDIKYILGAADHLFNETMEHVVQRLLLGPVFQCSNYFKFIKELHELSCQHDNRDDRLALNETMSILLSLKGRLDHTLTTQKIDARTYAKITRSRIEEVKATLEKTLDPMLEAEDNALILPRPEVYRFAEPDSPSNIIYEDSDADPPPIRSATAIKLIEKLTHQKSSGTKIVETFLITYRSFMSNPEELLDLLIERFRIPEPSISDVDSPANREAIERFRNNYSNPVKMKVINVIKFWVLNHYYDFERNPSLLDKLQSFLSNVQAERTPVKRFINSINKIIEKKKQNLDERKNESYNGSFPPFEWHTASPNEPEKFDILTLHPLELARQLTLIEFELFRAVKPSELINAKELDQSKPMGAQEKNRTSPNLSKLNNHINKISYWIRLCIIEAEDFNHRVVVLTRVIEIMQALNKLNNFSGLLCIGGAVESACVNRLKFTFKAVKSSKQHQKWLENYQYLTAKHMKGLQERLEKLNPPCIPFIGSCLTKLVHAKEGNRTYTSGVSTPHRNNSDADRSEDGTVSAPLSPRSPLTSHASPDFSSSQLSVSPSSSAMVQRASEVATLSSSIRSRTSVGGLSHNDSHVSFNNTNNDNNNHTTGVSTPQPMINFRKQRMRADIVAGICQYQNQPYCLAVQSEIRRFIENINVAIPGTEDDEESGFKSLVQRPAYTNERDFFISLDNYLYDRSLIIEPKELTKPPIRTQKRRQDPSWKSPGIEPRSNSTTRSSHPTALPAFSSEVCPGALHSPSTPLTPQTPPLSGGSAVSSEHSVFDQAFTSSSFATRSSFGGSSSTIQSQLPFNPDQSIASFVSSSTVLASSVPDEIVPNPPPLPPRRPIGSDSGNSTLRAPPLPPRTNRRPLPSLPTSPMPRRSSQAS